MPIKRNLITIGLSCRHFITPRRCRLHHIMMGKSDRRFRCHTSRAKCRQAQLRLNTVSWLMNTARRGSNSLTIRQLRLKSNDTPAKTDVGEKQELTKGTCIFTVPRHVQLFYIAADGSIQSSVESTSLSVIKLADAERSAQSQAVPPAFLHVGNWMYPLMPGISPVKATDYGVYLFPDVMSKVEGSTVAIALPEDLPKEQYEKFESILHCYAVQEEELQPTVDTTEGTIHGKVSTAASRMAGAITRAAALVSWLINMKSAILGQAIKSGSSGVKRVLPKAEEPVKMDKRVHQGVIYARQAATGAVDVTEYIVSQLASGSNHLAKMMAPYMREHGGRVLPKALQTPVTKAAFEGATKVTSSTLKGMGSVFTSLDEASQSLVKNLSDETVEIVQHTYGEEVGAFTRDTVHTAQSTAEAALNSKRLAMRKLLKSAAKSTGKHIIHEHASYSDESDTAKTNKPTGPNLPKRK